MSQVSFGTVLQEARERKGLDIPSVARRLRVRPDILRAIEASDFSKLPARGYTRNMVAAYARLVGVNSSDVANMYVDQFNSHQARLSQSETDFGTHPSGRRSLSREEGRQEYRRSRGSNSEREGRRSRGSDFDEQPRRASRQRTDENGRYGSRSQAGGRSNSESLRSSSRRGSGQGSRSDRPRDNFEGSLAVRAAMADNRERRVGHSGAVGGQFGNLYSGSHNVAGSGNRTIVIIGCAVILILLVVVFALIFGNRGGSAQQEVTKVPITGVTDTSSDGSGTSESEQKQSSQVTVPTSVTVEYKLASGSDAYVVITQDGTETDSMLSGPVTETVEVTGTWSLATYVSDAFTITMNGKAVEFTTDSTTGMPTATVSFTDYLKTWAEEHPDVKVDLPSSNSSSSSSTTTGSTTNSSTGTTSSSGTSSTGTTSTTSSSTNSSTGSSTQSSTGSTSGTSTSTR
jgi:cytoskeleton protein RodZ